MANRLRNLISQGGPDSGSAWADSGESIVLVANATLGTAAVTTPGYVVPKTSAVLAGGAPNPDALATGQPIQRLEGAQYAYVTTLAVQTQLALGVAIYRAGVILGGTLAFGWLYTGAGTFTGGTGTPAFGTALSVTAMPAIATNTALVTAGGSSYVPLQPSDLIVVIAVTQTGTVSLPFSVVQLGII